MKINKLLPVLVCLSTVVIPSSIVPLASCSSQQNEPEPIPEPLDDNTCLVSLSAGNGERIESTTAQKVTFYIEKGETWATFYRKHKYIGAVKDGYDFMFWTLDGSTPIYNDYVINKSILLKPYFMESYSALTFIPRTQSLFNIKINAALITRIQIRIDSYASEEPVMDWMTISAVSGLPYLPQINLGERMSFKGTIDAMNTSGLFDFDSEKSGFFAVSGNPSYLLQNTEMPSYPRLFKDCKNIISAVELQLSIEDLTDSEFYDGYVSMFEGCASLAEAPKKLPAKILGWGCYYRMFFGCTSLLMAPEIAATTMADIECCKEMFSGCTSLVRPPKTLKVLALTQNCYDSMFYGCISLVESPDLMATTASYYSYHQMFCGCQSLRSIKVYTTNDLIESYYKDWLKDVAIQGQSSFGVLYYNGSNPGNLPTGWEVRTFLG